MEKEVKKNLFSILHEMHEGDIKNGTYNLGVCKEVTDVRVNGKRGFVTVGVPASTASELIINDGKIAILLVVDYEAYKEILIK